MYDESVYSQDTTILSNGADPITFDRLVIVYSLFDEFVTPNDIRKSNIVVSWSSTITTLDGIS